MQNDELTEKVIGAAIDVHRTLGPGLLESAYEECLCYDLTQAGLMFKRQVPLPVQYKDVKLDLGYRLDVVIERRLILGIETVERIIPIHEAQLLTCLKLTGTPVGLLLNFNVPILRHGIKRMVRSNLSRHRTSQRRCASAVFFIPRRVRR